MNTEIDMTPAMLTLHAEEYGLAFRCAAYPDTGRHSTFGIHIHVLDETGAVGSEVDYLTSYTPEDGNPRPELIERARMYLEEMEEV